MHTVMILATIFGFILMALVVIGSTILFSIRIIKGGGVSSRGRKLQAEDAKMMQEIYLGLSRMEERINTLETILLEKERERHAQYEKI